MITNLFSVFDPRSSILSLAWCVLLIPPVLLPLGIWKNISPQINLLNELLSIFKKEVNFTLGKKEKGRNVLIITAFLTILTLNFLALYPQVFSPTSQLATTLPLSLTFWVSLIIFGWAKNTSHILSHLLPQGTPAPLIMFIVIIEIIRNIIRPITLCVRLTANLIAGHLLISLLGNSLLKLRSVIVIASIICPILLTILESAVACIQAYVFMTLITLYTTELK